MKMKLKVKYFSNFLFKLYLTGVENIRIFSHVYPQIIVDNNTRYYYSIKIYVQVLKNEKFSLSLLLIQLICLLLMLVCTFSFFLSKVKKYYFDYYLSLKVFLLILYKFK